MNTGKITYLAFILSSLRLKQINAKLSLLLDFFFLLSDFTIHFRSYLIQFYKYLWIASKL